MATGDKGDKGDKGDVDAGALPPSVAMAWGLRTRPGRGPKPGLTLERIVDAAVRLAASDGLAAVSMGRLAADLGVATMSLYRYVSSKDELITFMLDSAYGPPPKPPADGEGEGEGWREGLLRWAWAEHDALARHPWVLRVPLSGPPTGPNQIGWLEVGLRCLRGTGLTEAQKMSVMLLVTSFVRIEATVRAEITAATAAAVETGEAPDPGVAYGQMLAVVADPVRFPALRAVLDAGVFDHPDHPDDEFVFGIERILDGVAALVR
jgi:AcrR family transcriptional regulator